jgi:hypothetical protein
MKYSAAPEQVGQRAIVARLYFPTTGLKFNWHPFHSAGEKFAQRFPLSVRKLESQKTHYG